ncbi:hypothetical protein [Caulobacter sp.]|uniref:hypothetical protein n=1 Tax=Caulobacter sp. TaxID=78 RepID=UPI001B064847|nr:hypothetical protein [Caulobacter sp.]MBO9545882.1 hypothetical protein [Caulobacter sp.]
MTFRTPPVTAWSAALIGFGGTVALVVQAMRVLGVGSAFWGLTAGFLALGAGALLRRAPRT